MYDHRIGRLLGLGEAKPQSPLFLAVLIATVFHSSSAISGPGDPPPMEPEFVVSSALGDKYEIRLAYHIVQNRFLVVWADSNLGPANRIRAQAVRPDGVPTGPVQTLSSSRAMNPDVAHNQQSTDQLATARSLVVWSTGTAIVGRLVLSDGTPDGSEFEITSLGTDSGLVFAPALAKAAHNSACCDSRFLVVWIRDVPGAACVSAAGESCGIYGRVINVAGSGAERFKSSRFLIAAGTSGLIGPHSPALAFDYLKNVPGKPGDLQGAYFVTWAADVGTGQGTEIFGRFVDQDGIRLGASSFLIGSAPGVQTAPAVAYSPEVEKGRLLVVWQDARSGSFDIFGQRVNSDGSLEGTSLPIVSEPGDQVNPHVAYSLTLGQHLVTWSDTLSDTVSARAVNPDGSMPRKPFVISAIATPIATEQVRAAVSAAEPVVDLESGPASGEFIPNRFEYLVVWTGASTVGSGQADVFGRTVDFHLDSDGDGLPDEWETTGVDVNNDGVVDDLNDLVLPILDPSNPPHPRCKDVYLEIDWMDCAAGGCAPGDTHSHRLRDLDGDGVPDSVQLIVEAFQNATGIINLDSSCKGVNLHVDYGQLGGGNAIPEDTSSFWNRRANLDNRRWRVFHYAVSRDCTSGGTGGADLPGSNLWACGDQGTKRQVSDTAGTFMHELGHNLGLQHGGPDSINYKPNYLSVMNYAFSDGIARSDGSRLLDYSSGARAVLSLDETTLTETNGIGRNPALAGLQTLYQCTLGWRQVPADGEINWNCNIDMLGRDVIDSSVVSADINRDGDRGLLRVSDDWENLVYNFRVITNYGGGAPVDHHMDPLDEVREEIRRSLDKRPPVISLAASPPTLWPPNGRMVPVTISGAVTDSESGVNASTATYAVTDEYGSVQPSGRVTLGANGDYAVSISLEAARDGGDKDGRHYIITVTAQDNAGNGGSASAVVTVPHDRSN